MPAESRFSRKAEKLLLALLESNSIRDAARKVGMNEAYAQRVVRGAVFKERWDELRKASLGLGVARAQSEFAASVAALCSVRDDPKAAPSARVAAAQALLNLAVTTAKSEAETAHHRERMERLTALEEAEKRSVLARENKPLALPAPGRNDDPDLDDGWSPYPNDTANTDPDETGNEPNP